MEEPIANLFINGQPVEVDAACRGWTLMRFLHDKLGLSGTKQSCDNEGTCGTCTVIIDGKARRACLEKVSSLAGKRVETIETLQPDGEIPHPILQTVIEDGIFQCGYCAPGAIMQAKALLDRNSTPSQKEISQVLSSVICRCVGLNRMGRSVERAAAILRGDVESSWTIEDSANEHLMLEKITGSLKYTDDLSFPGMIYAQVLRANVPHARLVKMDTVEAEAMPGILRVITAKDIPGNPIYGLITADQPAICDGEIRYVGDALAVIVGETEEQVQAALQKINVELELLPVLTDPLQAILPGAPVLHESLKEVFPETPNVRAHHKVRKGDIEKGFAEADVVIEDDYYVPFIEHAFMEIECSIAVPEADGTLTVHCGSQSPTDDRRQIAGVLGMPEEHINVAHHYMGGSFGGKEDIAGQVHAALAAALTGRIVKIRWDRAESLLVHQKRHAAQLHYKMGATREGRLVAAEVTAYGDTGAYTSAGEAVLFRTAAFACGPYKVPNVKVDAYAIHTNNPTCGAFRGFGSPQASFPAELTVQKLADVLGIDGFEFRMMNALEIGDVTITGDVLNEIISANTKACLAAAKAEIEKGPQPVLLPGEKLGIGYAASYKNVGLGSNIPDGAGAVVSLEPGGTFLVRHGAADMGQGSVEVMGMIAARTLGVPMAIVQVHTGDTRFDPDGGMTTASRATFVSGNAVMKASQGLRDMLWRAVSEEFDIPQEDLEIEAGSFVNRKTGQVYLSLKDLAGGSTRFEFEDHYNAPQTQPIPAWSSDQTASPKAPLHFAYGHAAQAAMVAVNENTGAVRVLKLASANDVGLPINPRGVIGQIEGAAIQGLGYALSEDFPVVNGVPQVTKFKDLGLLRYRDLPEISPVMIQEPHPWGPYGAKGMGELAISPTAPAIAIAIHDAVGVWVNQLPLTKDRVFEALQKKKSTEVNDETER
jgi:CO/xanthine dehydrogenase Mo-binding subunit/aerobic-type carbon monoxide dehydrogenase small subunit (CoxS/CutS family)